MAIEKQIIASHRERHYSDAVSNEIKIPKEKNEITDKITWIINNG